ncbi:MAG: GtrA family protein [Gammaproteobacteria bacterium]
MNSIVFLIPAYQPSKDLVGVVKGLRGLTDASIFVVNDGSRPACAPVFDAVQAIPDVTLLVHAVKLGKGAALKTGFNAALARFEDLVGVVTVDADGQHRPEDAVTIGELLRADQSNLIMGCRELGLQHDVPLRSRFGNQLTKKVFAALTGVALSDTQTGLRGIPATLMKIMMRVSTTGYDFETHMLLLSIRNGIKIREHKIPTIYIDHNASSHFNPLLDSIRIYFVFIRFAFASIATAVIDFIVFALAHGLGGDVLAALIASRVVAGTFNFAVAKRVVFKSRGRMLPELARYVLLVAFFLFLSNSAISVLVRRLDFNIYLAKILVETSLFILSFATQRWIIFPARGIAKQDEATDWDAYYRKPFKASSVTRKITTRRILDAFQKYGSELREPTILELGGGNSCVYGAVAETLRPRKYLIVDKNPLGLKKFHETYPSAGPVELIEGDVLAMKAPPQKADICFSIGLIEHFSEEGTRKAIQAHFECVDPNGLVLITFPTTTWLYRITRKCAELLHMWEFPDEHPCKMEEVTSYVAKFADIHHQEIIWPIVLTQGLILAKPRQGALEGVAV